MDILKRFCLVTLLACANFVFASDLTVQLSTSNTASAQQSDDVDVTLVITNPTPEPVQVLKWYLAPNNKLQGNNFSISVDGTPVDYTGPVVKRSAPSNEDYITLAPGESITQTVSLSSFYNMTQQGSYQVSFDASALNLIKTNRQAKGSTQTAQTLKSNTLNVWLKGIDTKGLNLKQSLLSEPLAKGGISYAGSCSNSQKSTIVGAMSAAQSISNEAYNHLRDNWDNGGQSARYTTWFGQYNSQRYSVVANHFYKITDALINKTVTLNCTCEDDLKSAYAYVYPNQPYTIHVCNAFWNAPVTGTDSRAGTLVHEMSHFTVNGGTDDYAYGQYNAQNLARSNPAQAIQNADSHEYYAENTPALN